MLGALLALVAGGVGVCYWAFFLRLDHRDETRVEVPAVLTGDRHDTRPEPVLTLDRIEGEVEVALPGETTFHRAVVGERLRPQSRVRTSATATLTLRGNDGTVLKMLSASNARVEQLSRDVRRLRLGGGMVEVDVPDDPTRLFQLDLNETGDSAARTHGASFIAVTTGVGNGAVASNRGELILSAQGKEVTIHTGEVSRLGKDGPTAPEPMPASLFLKVAWPDASTREHKLPVSGQASQGSRVRVGDHFVPVDEKGNYRTEVTLPDGRHTLAVDAWDVAGHHKTTTSPPITVDTKTDFKVKKPNWGKK